MLTACCAAKKKKKSVTTALMWLGAIVSYSTAKKLKQQVTSGAKLSQSAAEDNT